MSSEFTFGDNSDKSSFFFFENMNLADHDLTEHQITQLLTVTTARDIRSRQKESDCSHTRNMLTGADKGNPTV